MVIEQSGSSLSLLCPSCKIPKRRVILFPPTEGTSLISLVPRSSTLIFLLQAPTDQPRSESALTCKDSGATLSAASSGPHPGHCPHARPWAHLLAFRFLSRASKSFSRLIFLQH